MISNVYLIIFKLSFRYSYYCSIKCPLKLVHVHSLQMLFSTNFIFVIFSEWGMPDSMKLFYSYFKLFLIDILIVYFSFFSNHILQKTHQASLGFELRLSEQKFSFLITRPLRQTIFK